MTTPRHDSSEVPGETPPQPAGTPAIGPRADDLEARIAVHREQETFHARCVAFHEAERVRHQQAVHALTHGEASPPGTAPSSSPIQPNSTSSRPWFEPPAPGRRLRLHYWIARLAGEFSADQSFTASSLAEILNRLCAPYLPRPIPSRQVSNALRRFAKDGQLRVLQPGTSHREAVYGRQVG